jgi:carboxypeptidase T
MSIHRLGRLLAASLLIASLLWASSLALGVTSRDAAAFQAEPGQDTPPAPRLYTVVLPAADAADRTALVQQGIAIDGLSGENAVSVMTDAQLAIARAAGLRPLAVTPLDFPPADADYHNYTELLTALADTAAAHGDIVRLVDVGVSVEGRPIPAVKISDHPERDETDEPAILFVALHHAREHLTVEMALAVIRLFTEGYGVDPALTNLVEQREIWVLPNANPDGGEYDVESGSYRYWRKNRRLNSDDSYGVDLNRNYGYRWGGEGSSPWPWSDTYRGPVPFSEPETQAIRDFVIAHPNLTAAISFHTYGELILYPYGYTYEEHPADMQPDDYRAFAALAERMAATNDYTPQQASALYLTAGDTVDWLYGERGIFAFTFEMYPVSSDPGFYPTADSIPRETGRNLPAVTYLTGMADHPRKSIGLGGDATAPQVTLTAVQQPGSPAISLAAEATDHAGVTLVAWQVDGATVALDRTPPYTLTWTALAAGAYDVAVLAFDAGANVGEAYMTIQVTGEFEATYLPLLFSGQ